MRPAHKTLSNKHTSPATGLSSTKELKQRKDVKQIAVRHVREARYSGAKKDLEMKGAVASETQMFAGCLIPWATSQARRKKVWPN